MQAWQAQEAASHFGELLRHVTDEGPQAIIVEGQRQAVIISTTEYELLKRRQTSLVEVLRDSPLVGLELDLERDQSTPGPIDL